MGPGYRKWLTFKAIWPAMGVAECDRIAPSVRRFSRWGQKKIN